MTTPPDQRPAYVPTAHAQKERLTLLYIAGAVALLALVIIGGLSYTGRESDDVLKIAMPIISAVLVVGYVGQRTGQQDEQVSQIASRVEVVQRQTNGVMDAKIRDGVRAVLIEAGLVQQGGPQHDPIPLPNSGPLVYIAPDRSGATRAE